MPESSIAQVIEALATKLGVTANEILPHFIRSCQVQAGLFCLYGVILIVIGIIFVIWMTQKKIGGDDFQGFVFAVLLMCVVFGAGFITYNITDVIVPQKPAYEQLITAIRG